MLAIIKEAYGDDYKMSAARAKTIAKIAKSLKGNKGGSGKGSEAKYDEDYNSILDDVFNNEENLKKHVVEKPEGFKVSVMELYYDDTDTVLMVIKKIKNSSGDVEKVSPITIAPSLHEKIRKLLNVTNAQLEYILKDYFDTSSVVKFKPNERLVDYLSPEEKEESILRAHRRRKEKERQAKEAAELKKRDEELSQKEKEEAEKKRYYKEDVIQAIDNTLKSLNLKEYVINDTLYNIDEKYYITGKEVIYIIKKSNNKLLLKINSNIVERIKSMFRDKYYDITTILKNFGYLFDADDVQFIPFYEIEGAYNRATRGNNGGQLQEEINKIKNMFKIL